MGPLTALLKVTGVIVAPEQIVCDKGVATTTDFGFTITTAVIGVPVQVLVVGVMVKVTGTGAVLVFDKAPLIVPVPLAATPGIEAVLFLVQV